MMRIEELTAKALEVANIDRYQLSVAVAQRALEIDKGASPKISVPNKNTKSSDIALLEIAEGLTVIKGFVPKED